MKISYVPGRELSYSRTKMFINGLEKRCELRIYGSGSKSFLKRNIAILLRFIFRRRRDEDVVIIGFLGQHLVILLKPFVGKRRLVFDSYLSIYNTMIEDKKIMEGGSFLGIIRKALTGLGLLGGVCFWLDKRSCLLADKVLLDTKEHIKYFTKNFGINKDKFEKVLIGADDSLFLFREGKEKKKAMIVGFHGLFIPLQGVEYIVRAAKLLEKEDIEFHLVGNGQTYDRCLGLSKELGLKNIRFLGLKKPGEIPEFISGVDIGLGIFGESEKTRMVIPNKAYEIIAMGKPLVTSDTNAIRELFTNKEDALLCNIRDEKSLADAILILKKDERLRNRIAKGGYRLYKRYCTPEKIGGELIRICRNA